MLLVLQFVPNCSSVLVRVFTNHLRINNYEIYLSEEIREDTSLGGGTFTSLYFFYYQFLVPGVLTSSVRSKILVAINRKCQLSSRGTTESKISRTVVVSSRNILHTIFNQETNSLQMQAVCFSNNILVH